MIAIVILHLISLKINSFSASTAFFKFITCVFYTAFISRNVMFNKKQQSIFSRLVSTTRSIQRIYGSVVCLQFLLKSVQLEITVCYRFTPCIAIYQLCAVPSIWLMEYRELAVRLNMTHTEPFLSQTPPPFTSPPMITQPSLTSYTIQRSTASSSLSTQATPVSNLSSRQVNFTTTPSFTPSTQANFTSNVFSNWSVQTRVTPTYPFNSSRSSLQPYKFLSTQTNSTIHSLSSPTTTISHFSLSTNNSSHQTTQLPGKQASSTLSGPVTKSPIIGPVNAAARKEITIPVIPPSPAPYTNSSNYAAAAAVSMQADEQACTDEMFNFSQLFVNADKTVVCLLIPI